MAGLGGDLHVRCDPGLHTVAAVSGAKFYRLRLAKGAPFSSLKVWQGFPVDPGTGQMMFERPFIWRAFLNGEDVPIEDHAIEFDPITTEPVIKGEPITEEDYLLLMKIHLHAKEYTPHAPEAHPRKPVDMNAIPPIKFA